jgi:cytochrome b
MQWHARFGYAVLALLVFRIVWGFTGGRWSRFRSFLYAPRSTLAYLRGRGHPDHLVGHNPLGSLSVFAMLAILLSQVGTGLVGDDEIAFTGPLNRFVTSAQGLAATWYHKQVGQWVLATLVALHLGALAWYWIRKRENLVAPMIAGDKIVPVAVEPSRDDAVTRLWAVVLLAVCCAAVAGLVKLGG